MQEVWSKLGVKSTLSTVGSHVCGLECIHNVCTYTRGVYPRINITSIPNNTLSPGKGVLKFTGYGPCAKPCAAVIHYCLMLPSAIYPHASEHSSSLFRVHPASLCTICAFVHHLCLCAPSASLCAICVFVHHLSSVSVSLSAIASTATCRHCLCHRRTPPLPLPLPPLHAAIAAATHHLCRCCCYMLPLPLPHTASAATTHHCRFLCHLCFFVLVAQPTIVATEMGGLLPHNGLHLCCHMMARISLPLPAAAPTVHLKLQKPH